MKVKRRTVKKGKKAKTKRGASCPTCRRLNSAANRAASAYAIHADKRNKACRASATSARCKLLRKQCVIFKRKASATHAAWRRHYSSCKK